MKTHDAYPAYTRPERIADGTVHALGVIASVAGAVMLIAFAVMGTDSAAIVAGVSVYAVALVATFSASAFYHFTPWESIRPTLRRFDHAAIYVKIAGTYTPLVVIIGSAFAYGVLGVVWALAVIGVCAKLFFWRTPGRLGPWLYLGMGWLSLTIFWPLFGLIPVGASVLITAGGLLYSLGVPFYATEKLRFSMAIWHGFVLAASACFFAAIVWGVLA